MKAIAYTNFLQGGGEEVWIAAPDGSHKRRLTRGGSPQLSPDGRRILAYRAVSEANGRLLVVAHDGGKPVAVAYGNLVGWSFSPDGKEIAYALQRGAHADVSFVPAGGGTARRVTNDG